MFSCSVLNNSFNKTKLWVNENADRIKLAYKSYVRLIRDEFLWRIFRYPMRFIDGYESNRAVLNRKL